MTGLADRIAAMNARLCQVAARKGRAQPLLVAVTKTVSVETVGMALSLGLTSFGENRVQEALPKLARFPHADWHFIGRLQTNKVRDVVGRFAMIHSLDRWKLAETVQAYCEEEGTVARMLVQVNVAGESQKGGLSPLELTDFLADVSGFSGIKICGLMTIPPFEEDPEKVRPYFREMYRLFSSCTVPGVEMTHLSMGMSGDYEVAVEEGANVVRIGSAIFGERN